MSCIVYHKIHPSHFYKSEISSSFTKCAAATSNQFGDISSPPPPHCKVLPVPQPQATTDLLSISFVVIFANYVLIREVIASYFRSLK